MEAAGQPVAQICQKLEISVATLARWRSQFRGMGDAEIKLTCLGFLSHLE
jgi:transposase-like protein